MKELSSNIEQILITKSWQEQTTYLAVTGNFSHMSNIILLIILRILVRIAFQDIDNLTTTIIDSQQVGASSQRSKGITSHDPQILRTRHP